MKQILILLRQAKASWIRYPQQTIRALGILGYRNQLRTEILAGHIQSGITLTVDRIPDLNAIAVPWGSGEDVEPGSWAIFLKELESAALEHQITIYLCKWGAGKGPGTGVAAIAAQRPTRVQFSDEVVTKQFNAGIFYHMTYDAEGRVTVEDTIKRQFKPLPRSNVGRGGKRSIQDDAGIQTQFTSNDTKEDVAYNICGQAAAIRAAINLEQQVDNSATNNSGIQREVLAWVGVSSAEGDYRCRNFGRTEDIGEAKN